LRKAIEQNDIIYDLHDKTGRTIYFEPIFEKFKELLDILTSVKITIPLSTPFTLLGETIEPSK
jgi:hypothetical protein